MKFHLAIPMNPELREATKKFYSEFGSLTLELDDYLIFEFYDIQLVCHSSEKYEKEPIMYPRHFGINFDSYDEWLEQYEDWLVCSSIFKKVINRFPGTDRAHVSFMLTDPSNNVLEFKHYFSKG